MKFKDNLVSKKLEEIGSLIEKFIPSLTVYLDEFFLNHEFITTQWIITIFSSSVKPEFIFKIWDLFLIFGWDFLNYFIISILLEFKDSIFQCDINKLAVYIKNMLKTDKFEKNFMKIIMQAFEFILEKEIYIRY